MNASGEDLRLIGIAWRLDRMRWVPTDVLRDVVSRQDICLWPPPDGEPPNAATDRDLAALLCGGCPVQDECLELELRAAGMATAGVWGGMAEFDRRALHPHWLRRGERADRGTL
jgi:WhiB family redox-sensing transcriptional regulator